MMLFSVDFLSQEEIVRVSVAAARSRESLKVLEFYSDIMWFSAAFHCPYKKKTMERKKVGLTIFDIEESTSKSATIYFCPNKKEREVEPRQD